MLLAIDVGNTNTVLGVYDGTTLQSHWRIETTARRTFDEYGILLLQLFAHAGLDPKKVKAVAVSSVVPTLQFYLEKMSERYFRQKPMFVGPGVKTGMPILYDNPREVGCCGLPTSSGATRSMPFNRGCCSATSCNVQRQSCQRAAAPVKRSLRRVTATVMEGRSDKRRGFQMTRFLHIGLVGYALARSKVAAQRAGAAQCNFGNAGTEKRSRSACAASWCPLRCST